MTGKEHTDRLQWTLLPRCCSIQKPHYMSWSDGLSYHQVGSSTTPAHLTTVCLAPEPTWCTIGSGWH